MPRLLLIPTLAAGTPETIFTVVMLGAAAALLFASTRQNRHWTWFAYGFALVAWYVVRTMQVRYVGWGHGFDVGLYESYGRTWGSGAAAYVEFSPEYPPGALILFLVPRFFTDANSYTQGFVAEMAVFDLLACFFVVAWAQRLRPTEPMFPIWPTALYLAFSAALYPVLYSRFDIAPGAMVVAATYFAYDRRFRWGAALLGAAAAVKLWPLALVPLWLGLGFRQAGWRRALANGVWIAVGILVVCAPTLVRAGMNVLSFMQYHEARGIEVGTTWSSLALLLNLLGWVPAHAGHDFGAFHIKGSAAELFTRISTYVTVGAALVPQVVAFAFGGLGRRDDVTGKVGLRATCATALGFMIGGKVLSPQFVSWVAPLLPVAAFEPVPALLALGAAVLTTVYYPFTAEALEMLAPGHGRAVAFIATRNALFVVLYGWLVYWLWSRRRPPQWS
jgi:hypothetical protein